MVRRKLLFLLKLDSHFLPPKFIFEKFSYATKSVLIEAGKDGLRLGFYRRSALDKHLHQTFIMTFVLLFTKSPLQHN